ncbi:hypothetical protein MD484_g1312, partial [Candolleomyces efflorescens]
MSNTPACLPNFYPEHFCKERQAFSNVPTKPAESLLSSYNPDKAGLEDDATLEKQRLKVLLQILELPTKSPPVGLPRFFSLESFNDDANTTSVLVRNANSGAEFHDLIEFKKTPHTTQPFHVTDPPARPDFVAARKSYWFDGSTQDGPADLNHVPWPCISLAGEDSSKDEQVPQQERLAISYLDLLLRSRSDLRGAFGLRVDKSRVLLLFGIGGAFVIEFQFRWASEFLPEAMAAMIYRLYSPGKWADPTIHMVHVREKHTCKYNITFNELKTLDDSDGPTDADEEDASRGKGIINSEGRQTGDGTGADKWTKAKGKRSRTFENFVCRYASLSFGTRTHVFVYAGPEPAPKVDGRTLRVIKNQLVQDNARFDEIDILRAVHQPTSAPGVVRLTCYEISQNLHPFVRRKQVRSGLEQRGIPFMSIKTTREMLMAAYDALEATRMLRHERNVLHRDMSIGNILVIPPVAKKNQKQSDTPSTPPGADHSPATTIPPVQGSEPEKPHIPEAATATEEQHRPNPASGSTPVDNKKRFYGFILYALGKCYRSLFRLIGNLCRYIEHDPHWLPIDNPRQDPEYIHECFQRLIFDFVMNHWDDPFMTLEKSHTHRNVGYASVIPSKSVTTDSLLAAPYDGEDEETSVNNKRPRGPSCMVSTADEDARARKRLNRCDSSTRPALGELDEPLTPVQMRVALSPQEDQDGAVQPLRFSPEDRPPPNPEMQADMLPFGI